MKKIIVVFVFMLSILGFSLLKAPTKAQAGNTCVDHCNALCGHCGWTDGGEVYLCPPGYSEKVHQE